MSQASSQPRQLRPVRQSLRMTGEMVVRVALAGFLFWVGSTDPDGQIVLVLCGVAGIYHLWVAFQILTLRSGAATWLAFDHGGVTLQRLWRRRHVPWNRVTALVVQPYSLLSRLPAGVRLEIGDSRGMTEAMLIPDVFEQGPRALLAELELWRQGEHSGAARPTTPL